MMAFKACHALFRLDCFGFDFEANLRNWFLEEKCTSELTLFFSRIVRVICEGAEEVHLHVLAPLYICIYKPAIVRSHDIEGRADKKPESTREYTTADERRGDETGGEERRRED